MNKSISICLGNLADFDPSHIWLASSRGLTIDEQTELMRLLRVSLNDVPVPNLNDERETFLRAYVTEFLSIKVGRLLEVKFETEESASVVTEIVL